MLHEKRLLLQTNFEQYLTTDFVREQMIWASCLQHCFLWSLFITIKLFEESSIENT